MPMTLWMNGAMLIVSVTVGIKLAQCSGASLEVGQDVRHVQYVPDHQCIPDFCIAVCNTTSQCFSTNP